MWNRITALLAIVLCLLVFTSSVSASLVLWYEFEGNADDSSGSNNHGAALGGPTYVPGKFGQAMHFDGIDDHIQIPDFLYTNELYEYSLTCWFKVQSLPETLTNNGFPRIFSHGTTNRNNSLDVYFRAETQTDPNRLRTHTRLADPDDPENMEGGGGHLLSHTTTEQMNDGKWHMYAISASAVDGCTIYIDGQQVAYDPLYKGAPLDPSGVLNIGRRFDATRYFGGPDPDDGLLDDFRIYDHPLSMTDVRTIGDLPSPKAYDPSPGDGGQVEHDVDLAWAAGWETVGIGPVSHEVFLGTTFEDVNTATSASHPNVSLFTVAVSTLDPGDLISGQTYYWRVDEFYDVNSYKGDIWMFKVVPPTAYGPYPTDEQRGVALDVSLSWAPGSIQGEAPVWHDVYLGTSFAAVDSADSTSHPGVFYANLGADVNEYDPPDLLLNASYYWRVDENYAGTTSKGEVWNFSVVDRIVVDDMDGYGDLTTPGQPEQLVYYVWRDGWPVTEPSTMPGNGTGAVVGHWPPPVSEMVIVHTPGGKSMPFYYDNDGTVEGNPDNPLAYYSETTAAITNLAIGGDWTKHGAKALSIWFRGDPANAAGSTEQMYAKLNNSKVVYDGNMVDIQQASWHEWLIDLTMFGIDLANVTSISLGFGDEANITTQGGSGVVYFDDIRLYPSRCLPDNTPVGDITRDCIVDYDDIQILANDWLMTDVAAPCPGLVARYEFEGSADDSSQEGHHAIVYGNPTYATGKFGQAMNFDSGGDDYLQVPDFDFANPLGEFTLSLWFRLNPFTLSGDGQLYQYPISYGYTNRNNSISLILRSVDAPAAPSGLKSVCRLADPADPNNMTATGGEDHTFTTEEPMSNGEWHMWTFTSDSNDGSAIYIDGDLVDSNPDFKGAPMNPSYDFDIGRKFDNTRYFGGPGTDGLLDDLRLYNYGLSSTEVAALMAGEHCPAGARADLYEEEPPLSGLVNFKDLAVMADHWLEQRLWP